MTVKHPVSADLQFAVKIMEAVVEASHWQTTLTEKLPANELNPSTEGQIRIQAQHISWLVFGVYQPALFLVDKNNRVIRRYDTKGASYDVGRHRGIPECCIEFFVEMYRVVSSVRHPTADYYGEEAKAAGFVGYIPCPTCLMSGHKVEIHRCTAECPRLVSEKDEEELVKLLWEGETEPLTIKLRKLRRKPRSTPTT